MDPFLVYMPSLKATRIEPWINSRGQWAVYVFGYASMRNGKVRIFKSRAAALKAGEAYLAYVRTIAEPASC